VSSLRLSVDDEQCCCSGQCVLAAPDLFDQREEDGIAVVLVAEPTADRYEEARTAARHCPSNAISVHERD
jgi:ferredoxin